MNEVINAILNRRSIRKYKEDPIPQDVLDRILEAGTYAPSAVNRQPAIIICITNKELRDKLERMNKDVLLSQGRNLEHPFFGAPAVILVLAKKSVPTCVEDGSLVIGNLMLAAQSEGLGTCWINRAKEEFDTEEGQEILKELGIEGEYRGIGHVIIGYPDGEAPKAAPRKENYIYYVK